MESAKDSEKAAVDSAKPVTSAEPAKLQQEVTVKKSRKEEKMQKKDDKIVEHFLKSLCNISSAEEKLTIVCKKYAEMVEENRRLKASVNQSDKKNAVLQKEKEQLQLEYNRTVLVKSKLENLCRELQKQNKTVKDESLQKIREEEERRKETQAKFQTTLTEITSLLQLNNEKNSKLRDDNLSMTNKFKTVVEQYELREQQVEKMAKQMSLEQQLADAKLAKANLEAQAQRERLMTEIAQLKLELGQYQTKLLEGQATEASLKGQVNLYTEKYDEFQSALMRSHKVFGGFKEEMDKMSKKIVKLEKEALQWKKKWEASQVALLEMAADKQTNDGRTYSLEKQLAQLQKLCRTMQAERTALLDTLKTAGVTPPPLPAPVPAPPQAATQAHNNDRVDAMAANCAHLKQSLAQLQSQLNVLTNKGTQEETTKTKKSKSKKKGEKRDKVEEVERKDIVEEVERKDIVEEVERKDIVEEVERKDIVEEKKDLNQSVPEENCANCEALNNDLANDKSAVSDEIAGKSNGVETNHVNDALEKDVCAITSNDVSKTVCDVNSCQQIDSTNDDSVKENLNSENCTQ